MRHRTSSRPTRSPGRSRTRGGSTGPRPTAAAGPRTAADAVSRTRAAESGQQRQATAHSFTPLPQAARARVRSRASVRLSAAIVRWSRLRVARCLVWRSRLSRAAERLGGAVVRARGSGAPPGHGAPAGRLTVPVRHPGRTSIRHRRSTLRAPDERPDRRRPGRTRRWRTPGRRRNPPGTRTPSGSRGDRPAGSGGGGRVGLSGRRLRTEPALSRVVPGVVAKSPPHSPASLTSIRSGPSEPSRTPGVGADGDRDRQRRADVGRRGDGDRQPDRSEAVGGGRGGEQRQAERERRHRRRTASHGRIPSLVGWLYIVAGVAGLYLKPRRSR